MKNEIIEKIKELVSITSVCRPDPANDEYPYGKDVNQAFLYVLELCRSFGFETKNCGNHTGWAQIGSGHPFTAILVHVDTVPLGSGWTHTQGEITNDTLYGRGVVDNKGPAILCIYAMKEILDSGKPIKGRIRIIFGQAEETGNWTDMEYYTEHEELPDYGFTPDADFPLIFAEKGACSLILSTPLPDFVESIQGGTAANVVPSFCDAVIKKDGIRKNIHKDGISAHASVPELGINAISLLMENLYELHKTQEISFPFTEFYHNVIGTTIHGERSGCNFEDKISGKLTLNAGTIVTENRHLTLVLDIRYPVTGSYDAILQNFIKRTAPYEISISTGYHMKPVYQDPNSPFVQTLLSSYRDITGDSSAPICIGGGTYARSMPNIVAFGALRPGRPLTEHQPDERILLEDLEIAFETYKRALKLLHL